MEVGQGVPPFPHLNLPKWAFFSSEARRSATFEELQRPHVVTPKGKFETFWKPPTKKETKDLVPRGRATQSPKGVRRVSELPGVRGSPPLSRQESKRGWVSVQFS